jgi:probable rRNA maturation factor
MIKIDVVVDELQWKNKIKRPKAFFQAILKLFPKKYNFKTKNKAFSLLLSNNKKIKILNKKFRKKNKSTDVLSFPLNKEISKNNLYLGDIIISYQYMNNPRSINNFNFKKKVIKIFIHGFLHLLGYDHIKEKDFINMFKEEERIFNFVERKIDKIIKI